MTNHYSLMLLLLIIISVSADPQKFKNLWYDGNAEIATYATKESRYKEIRNGKRVMVFVTEPMRLATHIKPDVKLAEEEFIRVIKLNDIRKFTTGIYDYSVMTSVFTSVESKLPFENMATMKISFTSQEWCGQVFDRIKRTPSKYDGVLYSYFESEGETTFSFDAAGVETEDNLWIRIRELNGPMLKDGESQTVKLIPSSWILRKAHVPATIVNATITKGTSVQRKTALGTIRVIPFSWKIDDGTTTVYVEEKYPHRITGYAERDGSSGELIVSKREPYWKQNGNKFDNKRKELGL